MIGIATMMKQIIAKCDVCFEGNVISKELLIQNYSDFITSNFEKKHNVAIILHTGSICFDIIAFLYATISNFLFDQNDAEDLIDSLELGNRVLYKRSRYIYAGRIGNTVKLCDERITRGMKLQGASIVPKNLWYLIQPYHGDSLRLDSRGIRNDNKKRIEFISSLFKKDVNEIPGTIETSSVIVMPRDTAARIINGVQIVYHDENANMSIFRLYDLATISYFSENEEYPHSGNPGRQEPIIKVTSKISVARDLVLGKWGDNAEWENKVIGLSVLGYESILRGRTELPELMNRRKLKYVFVSFNIHASGGESILDEYEDIALFACTKDYLLDNSLPAIQKNKLTKQLESQINNILDRELIPIDVKSVTTWDDYKLVQRALKSLKRTEDIIDDNSYFIIHAYSLLNLFSTAVFPLQVVEQMIENRLLDIESPLQQICTISEIASRLSGNAKDRAKVVVEFIENNYFYLLENNEKANVLHKHIADNLDKHIAIIVPKAFYANVLIHEGIHDSIKDEKNITISTANKFDDEQVYDEIIVVGNFEGKRFDPFRCNAAPTIYMIMNDYEKCIFKLKLRAAMKTEERYNNVANISSERDSTIDDLIYDDLPISLDEVEGIEQIEIDMAMYINRILEKQALTFIEHEITGSVSTVDIAYACICSDGEHIFFTKSYKAYVFDSAKEDVIETSVDKIAPGDTLLFTQNKSTTKDIVTYLLEKLIDSGSVSEDIKDSYIRSLYWKMVLEDYRKKNNLSYKMLSKNMAEHGAFKHEVTIRSWYDEDQHITGSKDDETYIAIAKMSGDLDMQIDPTVYRKACDSIRKIRIGILKLIAKTIINKFKGQLTYDDSMAQIVSNNIDNLALMVQLESITQVENAKAPINMVNKPIKV